jgi:hypothetical protein
MVLLQIDTERISILKLEGDAPGAVNVDGVPLRLPLKAMKVPAGDIHILWHGSHVQGIKDLETPFLEGSGHLGANPIPEKLFQSLMFEAPYHGACVA